MPPCLPDIDLYSRELNPSAASPLTVEPFLSSSKNFQVKLPPFSLSPLHPQLSHLYLKDKMKAISVFQKDEIKSETEVAGVWVIDNPCVSCEPQTWHLKEA